MASITHVVGVDPGIHDTGVVTMGIDRPKRVIAVESIVLSGIDDDAITDLAMIIPARSTVFIEKYVPRQHYGTDEQMVKAEAALRAKLPRATFIRNTGVKQIVSPMLMNKLQMWRWPHTHHQDLRAAARILLYGMMKDEKLNRILSDFVRDEFAGRPWTVTREDLP